MAPNDLNRRRFTAGLVTAIALPAFLSEAKANRVHLAQTPACGTDTLTALQTAGPFFTSGSPRKTNFQRDTRGGQPILLYGQVLDQNCRPVQGAKIDFWQADANGAYDNSGYRLRGHQFSDANGRWRLETILPGLYPGRTRHIHARVQPRGQRILTTQLYFPGIPQNRRDGLYVRSLLVAFDPGAGRGSFDFIL
ncbi:intradiol ring-cleavage dioxygenase [Fulvimarina endophytica]|uniref:Intradiol ring-cleavage dioxygenase n=1 Tax=Fulvimarina endophytica TaxID=2293836 RepID=A0A371X1S3_9HYPH|nr:intradiol ring-cleavage dioxygenase [Fulvimarina endophytica]RFC63175.1 intradiol ring-cleavage dioxygenase [Fulvimarina endophytica]